MKEQYSLIELFKLFRKKDKILVIFWIFMAFLVAIFIGNYTVFVAVDPTPELAYENAMDATALILGIICIVEVVFCYRLGWGHYRQDQGLRYSWDRDDIDELEQRIEELEKQIKELERRL